MQNNSARRASIYLGVFMAVVLVGSALLQLFQNNLQTSAQTVDPTDVPSPTFPPPLAAESLDYTQRYFHPSGLFLIGQPTGFTDVSPSSNASVAQVNMRDGLALVVVDAFVQDATDSPAPLTSADLSARFTQELLDQTWASFNNWTETSRRIENDQLVIDFEVTFQRQTYAARQKAWTDGEWVYAVRVVAPSNATASLITLLDQLVPTVQPIKLFAGTPFQWQAYYDAPTGHIIRHPETWFVTDSAPGLPATINGSGGEVLVVETRANTSIADEAAAGQLVESLRPGASILSTAPVERVGIDAIPVSGYSVAYSTASADGEPESGLVTLLNGGGGTLHIANLRFPGENVDLNALRASAQPAAEAEAEATADPAAVVITDPATSLYEQYAQIGDTFYLLPPLNLSPSSLPPTATPRPTLAPTVESTAESTSEATDAAAEATGEATGEAATDEATTEATIEAVVTEAAATEEAVTEEAATDEVATDEATSEAADPFPAFAQTATALAGGISGEPTAEATP